MRALSGVGWARRGGRSPGAPRRKQNGRWHLDAEGVLNPHCGAWEIGRG